MQYYRIVDVVIVVVVDVVAMVAVPVGVVVELAVAAVVLAVGVVPMPVIRATLRNHDSSSNKFGVPAGEYVQSSPVCLPLAHLSLFIEFSSSLAFLD